LVFFDVGFGPDRFVNVLWMHGLAEGIGNAFGKFVGRDVVGTRGSRPSKLKGPIHDTGAPCGGKITEVTNVLGLAGGVALLYKGPKAFGIDEQVAAAAVVIGNESNFGVVSYPFGEPRELGGVVQVTVNWEHRVIGGRKIERWDVDGIGRVLRKECIPGAGTRGDINDLSFIDFAVNECEGGSAGREGFLGRRGSREKATVEATVILKFGKGIFEGSIIVEAIVSRN
jgi:hypothetical protein